jgi:hypothetical protein
MNVSLSFEKKVVCIPVVDAGNPTLSFLRLLYDYSLVVSLLLATAVFASMIRHQ